MFVNTIKENWSFNFSNNVANTCQYWYKISRNTGIESFFHFKAYFCIFVYLRHSLQASKCV